MKIRITGNNAKTFLRSYGARKFGQVIVALVVLSLYCGSISLLTARNAFAAPQVITPTGTAAQPIPSSFFGMTTLDFHRPNPLTPGAVRSLDVYAPNIIWATINTAPGVYDWRTLDLWVAQAVSRNQKIIFMLGGTPTWASPHPTDTSAFNNPGSNWPPVSIDIWSNWVSAVATRYRGKIKYYELWNEPDTSSNWPVNDPNSFAEMYQLAQVAHNALRAADPAALLTTPSYTATMWAPMLGRLLAYGTQPYDVIAFHSYGVNETYNNPEAMATLIQAYKTQANNYGLENLPLISTEGSWGTGGLYLTNKSQQADFLVKDLVIHAINGVSVVAWYAEDAGPEWGQLEDANGLNPAGIAYQNLYKWLVGSSIINYSIDPNGTYIVNLAKPDGTLAAIVWNSQRTILYQNPAMRSGANAQGDAWWLNNGSLYVGSSPIYVSQ